jgi:ADP-heptose:LPS heptosyltransferase
MARAPSVSRIRGGLHLVAPEEPIAADSRWSIGAFGLMRRIDHYLGPPLCLILGVGLSLSQRLRRLADGRPAGAKAPTKVLVVKFWGMGSIVLTTPALRALKKAYPRCRVTFLTFEQNEPICRMIRLIDRVHPYRADGPLRFLVSLARLVGFLRREKFDVVVDFEFFANFTSILTGLAGAPTSVGFHSPKFWRDTFYTIRVPFEHAHITENFLRAAEALGATADGHHLDGPVASGEMATARLEQLLGERGVGTGDPLVCININASSLDYKRRWPLESYRQLIERILGTFREVRLVLIGSKAEAPYVAKLIRCLPATPQVVDMCGLITLEQLAALLQRSLLFIGNDSGPLHLAAAAGIPTVSFFGPETPVLYGPRGDRHTVFYAGIPCSPCLNVYNSKDNSGCRNNLCMQAIGVDEAWAAVYERLAALAAPRPAARAGRWR